MRLWVAVVAMWCSACAHIRVDHIDAATLATSTAGIACDWGYTHRAASRGWMTNHEANPMLGETPSTGAVGVYFASVLAVNAVAWLLTPSGYRSALPVAVTARTSYSIINNSETVGGVCGF